MKIEKVELRVLSMPLKAPFETSFLRFAEKECVFVTVYSDGVKGYGESVAFPSPHYNEETTETVWHMLERFLIPVLLGKELEKPEDVARLMAPIRRNYMAIAALEGAVWDAYSKQQGLSLAEALGGHKREIDVGVSIGIEPTIGHVLRNVDKFLQEGYKRIKVKIKPGFDIRLIEAIRKQFGDDIQLMADANSAYTLQDADLLKQLDPYKLLMIEQPLAHDDIIDHAELQRQLETPICLDESIHTVEDARKAIQLGSCKIVNIKVGRVGGLTHSRAIHDLCQEHGIPVWCGGMFETGVGRAHNIALTSLPNFTLPGDTSASSRYWVQDIVEPGVEFIRPGTLAVPAGAGIGYEVGERTLDRYTLRKALL
ncbi:o-succinylbenzoate synthase [Paenibacillus ginsengarvi]|uniref:o-succinylbenzoate synthase n=1 Tax=Paenibacillus ginsengarvi TaxID=400777 RepID=A0A3B0CB66_9BACL|nr:o-succinylbenzoate synthase [Paenibacillus ginsengarvi]RKN81938.1 o-succinylbenzoate synthase [Paenibacillus ginsengarvi]